MSNTKTLTAAVISACLLLTGLSSCNRIKGYFSSIGQDGKNPPVARVYDTYLYKKDLPDIVPAGTSSQDSTAIIRRYIDSWITRQLILNSVQMNMPDGDLEKEVAEFKELLLMGRYEQYIISEHLDTAVTEQEIATYYKEHKGNLTLNKDVVCWTYLPITYCDNDLRRQLRSAFSREKAPSGYKGSQPWEWTSGVEQVMAENSYNAPLVKNNWTEIETIVSKYETDRNFASSAQKNGYTFEIRNDEGVYLGRITRYIRRGNTAPLDYVRHQIKGIILNRRIAETLEKAETELKRQAEQNHKLEIFNQDEDQ